MNFQDCRASSLKCESADESPFSFFIIYFFLYPFGLYLHLIIMQYHWSVRYPLLQFSINFHSWRKISCAFQLISKYAQSKQKILVYLPPFWFKYALFLIGPSPSLFLGLFRRNSNTKSIDDSTMIPTLNLNVKLYCL